MESRDLQERKDRRKRLLALLLAFLVHIPVGVWFWVGTWIDKQQVVSSYGIEVQLGTSPMGLGESPNVNLPSQGSLLNRGSEGRASTSGQVSGSGTTDGNSQNGGGSGDALQGLSNQADKGLSSGMANQGTYAGDAQSAQQAGASLRLDEAGGGSQAKFSQRGDTQPATNQGEQNGSTQAENLRGNSAQDGVSYQLKGWLMTSKPRTFENSNETGKLTIKFRINRYGEVLDARTISSTVSLTVAQHYEEVVKKEVSFKPVGEGEVPDFSVGKITFILTRI